MTPEQKAALDAARARHQAAVAAAAGATEATQKAQADAAVAEAAAALKVAEAAAASGSPDHVERPDGTVQMLTPSAFKKLKDGARTKGRQELMAELNEKAKEHGFASYEAMMLAATKRAPAAPPPGRTPPPAHAADPSPPGAPPTPPPRGKADRKAWDRYQREKATWAQEKTAYDARIKKAEKRTRQLERENNELAARSTLERIAIMAGVRDVDYAIAILRRHVSPMNEEQLAAFDEQKFFTETLKTSHPYLYGDAPSPPATTGLPGAAPPPPKPGAKPPNGVTDVRQMTDEQFRADLKRRGLAVPTV